MEQTPHIQAIDKAIAELQPLSVCTAAPASIQFQYIGTIIDNTMTLLTSVGNSLDGGQRVANFSEFENWISAMVAVHRSFYSSLIIAVEQGLSDFCTDNGIEPYPHRLAKAEEVIEKASLSNDLAHDVLQLAGIRPSFDDYLREVIKAQGLPRKRGAVWTKFFGALNIVRNKVSHSDISLSSSEAQRLRDGGLGALVGKDKKLQVNPRNYKQIVEFVLQFYQEASLG